MAHTLPTAEQAAAYVATCYARWDCLDGTPVLSDGGIRWQGAQDDECTRVVVASVTYTNGETHSEDWDCWFDVDTAGARTVYGEC